MLLFPRVGASPEIKTKLRELRDRLAIEAPRALSRSSELAPRLQAAFELVSRIYLVAVGPARSEALDEAIEDAVVEAHLALHDWERASERERKATVRARTTPPERRRYERYETKLSVRIVHRHAQPDYMGGVTVESEAMQRPARDVSLGGIFVTTERNDLPEVVAGNVVHVAVTLALAKPLSFDTRAMVTRRENAGLALRWVDESAATRRAIETMVEAVHRNRLQ